jgi:hypothetical protein
MTMIAYAFLQHRRLATARREKKNQWATASANFARRTRRGYGRWLTFLQNSGADLLAPPVDRVTRENVAAYIAELRRQNVSPYTLRNRIMELQTLLLAFAPDRDWSWLKNCVVHLDRCAQDAADRSLPPILASELLDRGLKELRRRARVPTSCREAIAYRDWLMLTSSHVNAGVRKPAQNRPLADLRRTPHM